MVRETWVQPQVASYLRLFKKWYLITTCLTLSNIRYVSRVKWSNPGKGVAPSPIEKGALSSPSSTVHTSVCVCVCTRVYGWENLMIAFIWIWEKISPFQSPGSFWNEIDLLIDFNDMSTCLGLFYAEKLENCVHCTFIITFFVQLFLKRFCFWYSRRSWHPLRMDYTVYKRREQVVPKQKAI